MILIGGTSIDTAQLPFSDMMEYMVENEDTRLAIKLKTVAKSTNCFKVYLHESHRGIPLTPDVEEKTEYFYTDEDLISMLEGADENYQDEEVEENEDESASVHVFTAQGVKTLNQEDDDPDTGIYIEKSDPIEYPDYTLDVTGDGVPDMPEIEEVDVELPDEFLTIPGADDDIDKLRLQLENKQRIIEQKDAIINEMRETQNGLLLLQENQLLEMREEYEKKIEEANNVIATLKSRLEEGAVDPEIAEFGKFLTYAKTYKAAIREVFTEKEKSELGRISSPIYTITCGSGDSLLGMLRSVRGLMEQKPNAIFVDFTGDKYLYNRFRLKTRDCSNMLDSDEVDPNTLVKSADGVDYIPTVSYNDISLLTMDWVKVLRKILILAHGRPVFLLFNSINSFAVRYIVSMLTSLGVVYVFTKSNPVILSTLYSDIRFLPEENVRIVAVEFIDVAKSILDEISKRNRVVAFTHEVDWKRLVSKI